MTTITVTGLVHLSKYGHQPTIYPNDMTEYGDILVGPVTFEYEIPADFNPVASQVASLEKRLDEIADKYHAERKQIREQIESLLCIENSASNPVSAA